jgi:hypothetical protein
LLFFTFNFLQSLTPRKAKVNLDTGKVLAERLCRGGRNRQTGVVETRHCLVFVLG